VINVVIISGLNIIAIAFSNVVLNEIPIINALLAIVFIGVTADFAFIALVVTWHVRVGSYIEIIIRFLFRCGDTVCNSVNCP
jgi:hypothetical protein